MDEWEQIVGNPAIEKAAIAYVIECERLEGRTARDTRGSGRGGVGAAESAGDVESDGRIIEVKASGGWWRSGVLYFTPPQVREGVENPNYYVYIVENVKQGDPSMFEVSMLHGDDLRRLFAGAKVHRLYVTVRAADKARLPRLVCVEPEPPRVNDENGEDRGGSRRAMPILDTKTGEMSMHQSLRGLVISKWKDLEEPRWDLAQTVVVTVRADEELASRGLNPAPSFRTHRLNGDDVFVRNWTHGARFPFLSPR